MTDQITLDFDAPPAAPPPRRVERRRETAGQAADRAGRNADPAWLSAALRAVASVARTHGTFTTDDVWQALANAGVDTPDNRAMGAVMRRAAKDGICTTVNPPQYRPSVRQECHGRPVRIWQVTGQASPPLHTASA